MTTLDQYITICYDVHIKYECKESALMSKQKKDICTAILSSNLGKYQKAIDSCNKKRGCDAMCTLEEQRGCPKLKRHSKEMSKVYEESE